MQIKEVCGEIIKDSRNEKTILVRIKTNVGEFFASAPNGKSKGKNEAMPYKKTIENDIKKLESFKDYFSKEYIEKFEDLRRIEDIIGKDVGANTLFAFESAVLKALSKEQKKEIWQLINLNANKFPRLVGNCIGGGLHSQGINEKIPDFQEFLLIPNENSVEKNFNLMKKIKEDVEVYLNKYDGKFKSKKNDEDALVSSLDDKTLLEILSKFKIDLGIDVASSSFYKRGKYKYNQPKIFRTKEEQLEYVSSLIKNFNILYIEDAFEQEDFESFSKLLKRFSNKLIVGDDLTTTNLKRLEKAIEEKSINAIIVKPNQNGSLIKLKKICEFAKEKNIKIIISHRSGETNENILADLAFGFEADFIKCGITGKEREVKIKRLIEIEKKF
jgi:enolase